MSTKSILKKQCKHLKKYCITSDHRMPSVSNEKKQCKYLLFVLLWRQRATNGNKPPISLILLFQLRVSVKNPALFDADMDRNFGIGTSKPAIITTEHPVIPGDKFKLLISSCVSLLTFCRHDWLPPMTHWNQTLLLVHNLSLKDRDCNQGSRTQDVRGSISLSIWRVQTTHLSLLVRLVAKFKERMFLALKSNLYNAPNS